MLLHEPILLPSAWSDHMSHLTLSLSAAGPHPLSVHPLLCETGAVLLAARTHVAAWAAAVAESSSVLVRGPRQRSPEVSVLFDEPVRLLWSTAKLLHLKLPLVHCHRRQLHGGLTIACQRWWFARRRGQTFAERACVFAFTDLYDR